MPLATQKSRSLGFEGAERLEQIQAWWARYARIAGIAVAVVGLGILGYFFNRRTQSVQEDAASGKLAEANVYYWQGDYPKALELGKQVYAQYGSAPSGIEAHRLVGDASYWNGDFKGSIKEYRDYLARVKQGMLADAARRSLAYALESDGQFAEAANGYEALVGKMDRTSSAELLLAAARCYRALGRPQDAIARLKRLDEEFGETSYAQEARVLMGELQAGGR